MIAPLAASPISPVSPAGKAEALATGAGPEAETDKGQQQNAPGSGAVALPGTKISAEAEAELRRLQEVDSEVRRHEQAHRSAGGHLTGPATYQYTRGPDGQLYATSGEVSIQMPKSGGDPAQRIRELEKVVAAAMAPADPSPQDRAVAAQARQAIAQAQAELNEQANGGQQQPGQGHGPEETAAAYGRNMPENTRRAESLAGFSVIA